MDDLYDNVTGYPQTLEYRESDEEDQKRDGRERYEAPEGWKLQRLAEMAEAERRALQYPYDKDADWAKEGGPEVDPETWHEWLYYKRNTPPEWLVDSYWDENWERKWYWSKTRGYRREGKSWFWGFAGKDLSLIHI